MMIKKITYLIHIPAIMIGFLIGTIWVGLKSGFNGAIDWWVE